MVFDLYQEVFPQVRSGPAERPGTAVAEVRAEGSGREGKRDS